MWNRFTYKMEGVLNKIFYWSCSLCLWIIPTVCITIRWPSLRKIWTSFIVDRRHHNYTRPSMNKFDAVNLLRTKTCGILNTFLWKSSVISWQNTNKFLFGHVYMVLVTRAWQRSLVSQHASWVSQAHARNCWHSLLMNVVKINSQKPEKREIKIWTA